MVSGYLTPNSGPNRKYSAFPVKVRAIILAATKPVGQFFLQGRGQVFFHMEKTLDITSMGRNGYASIYINSDTVRVQKA
jgi:hypothetical protein